MSARAGWLAVLLVGCAVGLVATTKLEAQDGIDAKEGFVVMPAPQAAGLARMLIEQGKEIERLQRRIQVGLNCV